MTSFNEFMLALPWAEAKKIKKPEDMYNLLKADNDRQLELLEYIKQQHQSGFIRLTDKILHRFKRLGI